MRFLLSFSIVSVISLSALACWDGYKADAVKTSAPVYAQAGANSFQVATLNRNQNVCVEKKSDGFARIQYNDARTPNVPKFGYIRTSSLRSSTEAAACTECHAPSISGRRSFTAPVVTPRIGIEPGIFDDEPESDVPVRPVIRSQSSTPRAATRNGLGEPLPYADTIQRNISYGRVGKNFCGRAVGRILRASGLLPGGAGAVSTPSGFNGEDAYNYLMSAPGEWVDDKTACNRPGVILVHGDVDDSLKSRYRPGTRGYLKGDTYGHVEILGTDGNYHHFTSSSAPIDVILGNPLRRPLLHCMVSRAAMRGER